MTASAEQLAAQLLGAGIPATLDVRQVLGAAPCILVGPPTVDYVARSTRWQLVAVSASADPLAAWVQLDALVDAVVDELPVELAEPASFAPSSSDDPVPAYRLTVTTS